MKLSDVARGRKSPEKISLADKLDVARTLVRLEKRIETRRELNVIEQQIIDRHEADLADGTLRGIDVGKVVPGILKELGSGS